MNTGWIKLHRQFKDWEWYDDMPTKCIFIDLLMRVNWEPTKWRGIELDAGETVRSLQTLAELSKMSVRQWRTAIDKLIATGSVTQRRHGKHRILKVINFSDYQSSDTEADNVLTGKRQRNDKEMTLGKEVKKKRNKEVIITPTAKSKKTEREEDLKHARHLSAIHMKTNPAYKQKFAGSDELGMKIQNWAKDFRLLKEKDNATDNQIWLILEWLSSDNDQAEFWRGNIISGSKFRKHFPRLVSCIGTERNVLSKKEAKKGINIS